MNAASRIAALRKRLQSEVEGAIALTNPVNVAYITGFDEVFDEEEAHVALVTAATLELFTDGRYAEAVSRAAAGTDWAVRVIRDDMLGAVCASVSSAGIESLTVEDTLAHVRFAKFMGVFDGSLVPAHGWVEELREVKDAEEIERICAAQDLTDHAFEHILDFLRAGLTEREVALELEFFMRSRGSDGVAFPPIVASGTNSALPHAKVTDRVIASGDFLKMDFGARVDGYCADMTRTVVIGEASHEQRAVYQAVLSANLAGIEAVREGVAGRDVDASAREVLVAAGYGERFVHGLGHGVGREVHELPGVGPRSDAVLHAGSVITIEPGVYVPGLGGVRIEDLVVVEEGVGRVLTRSPKNLIEL